MDFIICLIYARRGGVDLCGDDVAFGQLDLLPPARFAFIKECSTGFYFFEKVQDLPTRGATAVQHFTINGSLFLAFWNYHGDIHKHKTSSMIYKMNEPTGKFTLYQTLKTRDFLAVANHKDGTYQLDSVIFQWNGRQFSVFQKIPTKGAAHFKFFTLNGEKYLAVANFREGSTYSVKSVIFKWNEVFRHFVTLQSLQTYGAYDVRSFNINGHTFLAFACYHSERSHNTEYSFIYKWDSTKFVLFQCIPTRGALAWHPFIISGHTYLGVANHYDSSQKYNT
ncbi:thrombospondin-type laminin G domain and EAR repeat-containing protein-like [Stylophora pistillata]|uniref:thrombospondin-type laminin G domain and EAR repeat-containing protein-like n=1 Tax=Stylophora pistillata TaxID=50429 RepID=UPI000C045D08|nr:thrombospondin-type laminin G domain and EAR repeat-containing protein-like [Stylophora pistillata]